MTASGDAPASERAVAAGAADCLAKPLSWPTLPQHVEFVLDNHGRRGRALLQALPDPIYCISAEGDCIAHLGGMPIARLGGYRRRPAAKIGTDPCSPGATRRLDPA